VLKKPFLNPKITFSVSLDSRTLSSSDLRRLVMNIAYRGLRLPRYNGYEFAHNPPDDMSLACTCPYKLLSCICLLCPEALLTRYS